MRKAILNSREHFPPYDFGAWRPVYVVTEHKNTWRIWSWRNPFTRLVHKRAMGERIQPL